MTKQYQCKVENGKRTEETGYFYKAIAFSIQTPTHTFMIDFCKTDAHAVVYQVTENNHMLEELSHPDYVPEVSPGNYVPPSTLSPDHHPIYEALVQLDIIKDKEYINFYTEEDTAPHCTYSISQKQIKK